MSLIITTIKQQKQQYYIFKIEKKNHNNSKEEERKCYYECILFSERRNPLPPLNGQLFLNSRKGLVLYAPFLRRENIYRAFCYTNCEALAGTRNT